MHRALSTALCRVCHLSMLRQFQSCTGPSPPDFTIKPSVFSCVSLLSDMLDLATCRSLSAFKTDSFHK